MSKINHIGIAVSNLEEAIRLYISALGVQPDDVHRSLSPGLKMAMLPAGDSEIELMEPVGAEVPVARFMASRGEGIHHICFEVDDINEKLRSLSAAGISLIDKEPRQGINGRIAFVHPRSMRGVLVEFVQKTSSADDEKTA